MLKISGECKCGLKREIECDDPGAVKQIKDMPCYHCGGTLKYTTGSES